MIFSAARKFLTSQKELIQRVEKLELCMVELNQAVAMLEKKDPPATILVKLSTVRQKEERDYEREYNA